MHVYLVVFKHDRSGLWYLSLSTGNFPLAFKHSLVTPLPKKANLDKENLSNYRPISNLSFLSKVTERIVLSRLNHYLSSNSLLNPHQSHFTKHHSTETLSLCITNWSLPSAISKFPAYVSSTSLLHLTL